MAKLVLSFFFFFGILYINKVYGQYEKNIQWASYVINYSSEFLNAKNPNQYSAAQILGKPNKLPIISGSPCAWSPSKRDNGKETIQVGFQYAMRIRQVAIGESYNAGAIQSITLFDTDNKEHLIYETSTFSPTKGGMFSVFIPFTSYRVKSVRLVLQTDKIKGWNHIDAIGISNKKTPIQALINLSVASVEKIVIEPLGLAVNSEYDEILPVISPDGNTLYFDRKNHPENTLNQQPNDDIWFANRNEKEEWEAAKRIPAPLNNDSHNYVCSVTPDGNTLLLGGVYNSKHTSGGVSMSHRTANGWSFPKKLTIRNYQNTSSYSEFSLSNDKKTLLLAIKGKSSKGDRDIYVSFRLPNGDWSEPQNLGATINTAATELTPFLASDGRTLYFSSFGFSGYGSADMYVSRRLDNSWTKWTEPINLGDSFNSADWDASYTIDAAGQYAYFVSYKNTLGQSADIFRAKLPRNIKPTPVVLIEGIVYNSETKQPIEAEIVYEILPSGEKLGKARTSPNNGTYRITLPLNEKYAFWGNAKGFLGTSENISLKELKHYAVIKKDLYLTPLKVGQKIRLNNLFFVQSTDTLLRESYPELNRMVEILKLNPKIKIKVQGHTDIGGSPIKNMELSRQRVRVIKKYLSYKGISASRIDTEAFGSTQPISRLRDEKSKKLNRRVEFLITEN